MLPDSQQQAYDRAITIFSPDGRLYQVEYAREAVKRGTASVGIAAEDGVVLVAHKRIGSELMESENIEKIFEIDSHIGAASAGHVTDARKLIDILRQEAQVNRASYEEPIGVETVVRRLCDEMQEYTQSGGVRPFGVSLIVGGIEDGEPRVFETDPSGSFYEWRATSIGGNSDEIRSIFEDEYDESLDVNGALDLAFDSIEETSEDDDHSVRNFEAAVVDADTERFRQLPDDEIE
ncbi:MAG: archaeal proteasome endopeptidase complex subunit alpha, partial [Halobacteria archaeon]|nr:archaeal proteasome endopeptidase complex subunit alpha [Halobacteria archaeon]